MATQDMSLGTERLAEGLLEAAPDAIVIVNGTGRIFLANARFEALFGYAREDLIGEPLEMLIPTASAVTRPRPQSTTPSSPTVRQIGEGSFQISGGRGDEELRARSRDGREFPIEINMSAVESPIGQLVYASVRDITESWQPVDPLLAAEQGYRSAFEDSAIGMALVTLRGGFLKINTALTALFGYGPAHLRQMRLDELVHPDDRERVDESLQRMRRGEIRTAALEVRYVVAGGVEVWADLSIALVRDRSGQPVHFVHQIQDITERRALEAKLLHLTDHDPLTGLINRRGLEVKLGRWLSELGHAGVPGALVVFDLDHFKSVNDTVGHSAGDQLIVSIANLLSRRVRPGDIVARLDGDAFALLLGEIEATQAIEVAEAMVRAIAEHATLLGDHGHHQVTASAGVIELGLEVAGAEDALLSADVAMCDAKEAGRDRVAFHSPAGDDPGRTRARLQWIRRIREAIREERFTFHLQPVVGIGTDEVRQHELLLRMIDETGELISPTEFLAVAERYGLIEELDRWVARKAIELIAESARCGEELILEVNMSGNSLGDPRMLRTIEQGLERTGIDPAFLIFEVTESAAITRFEPAREFAQRLMALGCRFALDDFGAGFGSFHHLKQMPFDYLKLGGDLVTACTEDRIDQFVIRTLVGVARGLRKQIIASHVEDQTTLEMLRSCGVDFVQGNYVGVPVSVSVGSTVR